MARRAFALSIDLNGEPGDMNVSEFLTYLSAMNDDSKKVNDATDFILNLNEELFMITNSEYEFPNCIRFLKDAIATVETEKWKYAKRARGIPIVNNETKDMNQNEGQTGNVSDESFLENEIALDINLDLLGSELSVQGDAPILLDPTDQPEYARSDPNVVQEVTRRQRMIWSLDLHRKFKYAVEALGGPREAKPKQIHDLLKIDDLTTEQIKSHLQRYRKHLNSRGQLHSSLVSNQNMPDANPMLVRTRFSLLCMQPGETSNNHMERAPDNKMI